MSKELGPRERQLREQREARYARAQALIKLAPIPKATKHSLVKAVAEAAKKTGKGRKKK